jgi:hypothetical protein
VLIVINNAVNEEAGEIASIKFCLEYILDKLSFLADSLKKG